LIINKTARINPDFATTIYIYIYICAYTYRTSIAEGTTESNEGAKDKKRSDGVIAGWLAAFTGALFSKK
jgi:hypothetical protein